jgi:heme exporter protein CcmD
MLEHLAFGKYGWFVWPSIAIFVIVVGALIVESLLSARRVKRELERLQREETR